MVLLRILTNAYKSAGFCKWYFIKVSEEESILHDLDGLPSTCMLYKSIYI